MTDNSDLARRLRRYSKNAVTNRLDSDFADAVREAAEIIEGGKPMKDVTFNTDEIRKAAVEIISTRGSAMDDKFGAYCKGIADLCTYLAALAGEEDDR